MVKWTKAELAAMAKESLPTDARELEVYFPAPHGAQVEGGAMRTGGVYCDWCKWYVQVASTISTPTTTSATATLGSRLLILTCGHRIWRE